MSPTSTPSGTPTITPTPTPTPVSCSDAIIELNVKTASTGTKIVFFGCIPASGNVPVDVYLVCFSPAVDPYSVLYTGSVAKGLTPYYAGVWTADCLCMTLWTHIACPGPPLGTWKVVLAVLPHGATADARNVTTYALQTITMVP